MNKISKSIKIDSIKFSKILNSLYTTSHMILAATATFMLSSNISTILQSQLKSHLCLGKFCLFSAYSNPTFFFPAILHLDSTKISLKHLLSFQRHIFPFTYCSYITYKCLKFHLFKSVYFKFYWPYY